MDEFSRKGRLEEGTVQARTGSCRKMQQAVQDAEPLQLGTCWLLRHLPGSADNYRWFWEKGKVQVSMNSCEEGDHVGNVKDTSANIHLVLGLVVQACHPSYCSPGRRIKSSSLPSLFQESKNSLGNLLRPCFKLK